ncbi:DUF3619 family protein [Nitrogeniibacter mangrovi]|uniref:DUF3619 family protein n=1 Tax=Nitrogeniibacter mangrovi TaxID=2016596 RepID=A0A6C1B113_9RHOO|nr:DUF3619 family protein [Nitrogeniibacter mangrovi]QID17306.1 DUF3619 family protein [Nitrogeniibacter mangrovi]
MNDEQRFGRRIEHLLSESTADLDGAVLARLREARVAAVKARKRSRFDLLPHRLDWHLLGPLLRPALGAALVLAVFAAGGYLNGEHTMARRGEVEMALLADDLPIDAYLDQGFRAWLEHDSPS